MDSGTSVWSGVVLHQLVHDLVVQRPLLSVPGHLQLTLIGEDHLLVPNNASIMCLNN